MPSWSCLPVMIAVANHLQNHNRNTQLNLANHFSRLMILMYLQVDLEQNGLVLDMSLSYADEYCSCAA
jgi:hypothetical protein